MIQGVLDSIVEWLKEILIDCIMNNLTGMFDQINTEIGEVAANVGTTPAAWNAGVFSMIRTLSDNVVVPIAGMILTFVLCYELITMIIDRNNLHDFETFIFYKWIVKAFVAVMLVTHTFDITMAIFDVAQHIVQQSAGIISSSTSLDFAAVLGNVSTQLEAMEIGELLGLVVETMMLRVTAPIISLCVMLVLVGRMMEIYIYCSVGAIPLATMTNHEWGQMGHDLRRYLLRADRSNRQRGQPAPCHLAMPRLYGAAVLLAF